MILTILGKLSIFIITSIVVITTHELGHFLVARFYGVKIERFSIGFGKVICSFKDKHATEYAISLIPLGGYVKIFDDYINIENKPTTLTNQNVFKKNFIQRSMIIAAGPLSNFLFAIFIYYLIFLHGISFVRPVVKQVIEHSIAEKANISSGMEFKSIDGINTPDWESVRMVLMSKSGSNNTIPLTMSHFGTNILERKLLYLHKLKFDPNKEDPLISLGIKQYLPQIQTTIAVVLKNSPASIAGLEAGDKLIKVNKVVLNDWHNFATQVLDNPSKKIFIEVNRKGKTIPFILIPQAKLNSKNKIEGFVGLIPTIIPISSQYVSIKHYGIFTAIKVAFIKVLQLIKITIFILVKFITGNITPNNLSGPISIAKVASLSAQYGIIHYMMFLALLSINLGIINLCPLPVLDGGRLFFLLIEKIKGREISKQVQDFSYRIGLITLMILMGLAFFNDFLRLS